MYAAESTITKAKDLEMNWFDASESIVQPLLSSRQELETLCAAIFHHMPVLSMKMATIKRNQKQRQCSFLHIP
jgi:hypothetical protein